MLFLPILLIIIFYIIGIFIVASALIALIGALVGRR